MPNSELISQHTATVETPNEVYGLFLRNYVLGIRRLHQEYKIYNDTQEPEKRVNKMMQLTLLTKSINFVQQHYGDFATESSLLSQISEWRNAALSQFGIFNPQPLFWESNKTASENQSIKPENLNQYLPPNEVVAHEFQAQQQAADRQKMLSSLMPSLNKTDGSMPRQGLGGNFYKNDIIETLSEYYQNMDMVNSDLLFVLGYPGSASLEISRLQKLARSPVLNDEFGKYFESMKKFINFDRDGISDAIGKLGETTIRSIESAKIMTHDLDRFIKRRFDIDISVDGVSSRKLSLSLGDVMSKMELKKYKEGIMSNDENIRDRTKKAIILELISEKTGFSEQQIKNLKHSNLFLPSLITEEDIKSGNLGMSNITQSKVNSYKGLSLLTDGLASKAEMLLILTGRTFLLDPQMVGFVDYKQRGVLALLTYWAKYNVGPVGMKAYLQNAYGSMMGTDLDKIHPLLMKDFNIENGSSPNNGLVKKRKEMLNWILRSYRMKNQYKIAEDIIAGTNPDNYFIDPVTKKKIELKSDRQKLNFLLEHKEGFGDMATSEVAYGKFKGLKEIMGSEFDNLWNGVDFKSVIIEAMKANGLSETQIAKMNSYEHIYGVGGLEVFLRSLNNYNVLRYNNESHPPNDFGKWFRYLSGVEQVNPLFLKIFKAFNASPGDSLNYPRLREEILTSAAETTAAFRTILSEGTFAHYSDDMRYELMEGLVSGLIDMAGEDGKTTPHRFKVDIGTNEYSMGVRKLDNSNKSLIENKINKFGWYVEHDALTNGLDPIYQASRNKDATLMHQYNSRNITYRMFQIMLEALRDGQMLTNEGKSRLDKHFRKMFPKSIYRHKYETVQGEAVDVGVAGGTFLAKLVSGLFKS